MNFIDKVIAWADWTAERIDSLNEYPMPLNLGPNVPWFEEFLDLLGEDGPPTELVDAFEAAIGDRHGFEARLAGLDLFFRLGHQDPYPYQEDVIRDAQEAAFAAYRTLVAAIAPGDVPLVRKHLDWEIRISSAMRMWDRGDALLGCLRSCPGLAAADANAVRAQHLFMRRYLATEQASNHDMAGWFWSSRPVNELSVHGSIFWAAVAAAPPLSWTAPTDAPPPETVYEAVAEASWLAPSWLKPLLRGRVESELELRPEAIADFELVLADSDYPATLREFIYNALFLTYEQGGETQATQKLLERWAVEKPTDPRVVMKLASAAADAGEYAKAYRFLDQAVRLNPELERETGARIGLALGALNTESTTDVRAVLTQHPDLEQALTGAISVYWPPIARLDLAERLEWAAAIYTMRVLAATQPSLAVAWNRKAATGFMTVVEVLLRRRVFAPIAELASLDLNVIKAAKTTRKDSRDWILSQYVMKSGDVSLAQMVRILKTCRKDPSQLSQVEEFAGSRLRDSPVSAQLDALNRIAAARNPAIHELATMDAESTHADARAVVEACLAHDSGRQ